MSNPEKLIELLSKEEKALKNQKEKRVNLDKQIKNTEIRISKYENALNKIRLTEAEELFREKGTSLDDIVNSMKQGEFSNLVSKIEISDILSGKSEISEILNKKIEINSNIQN